MAEFYVCVEYYIDLPDVETPEEIMQTSMDIEGESAINKEGDLVFNGIAYASNQVTCSTEYLHE